MSWGWQAAAALEREQMWAKAEAASVRAHNLAAAVAAAAATEVSSPDNKNNNIALGGCAHVIHPTCLLPPTPHPYPYPYPLSSGGTAGGRF